MLKREFSQGASSLQLTPEQEAEAQRIANSIAVAGALAIPALERVRLDSEPPFTFSQTA